MSPKFTFIDLFAGIGGFHQAMHSAGGECVFASELNKHARATYIHNYRKISPQIFDNDNALFNEDINSVNPEDIPNFDVCCAGFPCQPFSIAGHRKGFEDTRGTLFFNIANIVQSKIKQGYAPKVLLLENVKGLKNHRSGETLSVILDTLRDLGYSYSFNIVNAKYFGVPQNRERLFIVAWYNQLFSLESFRFPFGLDKAGNAIYSLEEAKQRCIPTLVSDIFEPDTSIDPSYTLSDKLWLGHQLRKERNKQQGKGFGYCLFEADSVYCSTISARYWKDGSEILISQKDKGKNPRRLTPVEAGRLQGYNIQGAGWQNDTPNKPYGQMQFDIVVSKKEAYQQFGNSVAVPVVKAIAKEIYNQLLAHDGTK